MLSLVHERNAPQMWRGAPRLIPSASPPERLSLGALCQGLGERNIVGASRCDLGDVSSVCDVCGALCCRYKTESFPLDFQAARRLEALSTEAMFALRPQQCDDPPGAAAASDAADHCVRPLRRPGARERPAAEAERRTKTNPRCHESTGSQRGRRGAETAHMRVALTGNRCCRSCPLSCKD